MSSRPTNEMLGFVIDEEGAIKVDDVEIPPPPVATLSHDVPDKRMIITQLRIKNFKSYANEIVLGPFDKNFSAVVGANGSGKSNVIDSLLFVFGYKARKIRSKKVSHLIHKSARYPNVKSCTVTVKFAMIKEKDDTSYEIIPGTEFILSRTALCDDSSHYEMNKKRTPYKEVAKALRHYGVDLEHSRFLILQGEIEAISLMPPKAEKEDCGMLEYIDDIIGTNRYIEPIEEFKKKRTVLEEDKTEKFNNLKLIEKEKDDLEQPKNRAVEYLRLENTIILSENSLLHCKRFAAEKEYREANEKRKQLLNKLNELKKEIDDLKKSRKAQEGDIEKINSELDIYLKELEKCSEAYKTFECKDAALKEEIKHLKSKKSKLESTLTSMKEELVKLTKQLNVYESETSELLKMKEKLDAEKTVEEQKLSEVMDSMQTETNILQEKKDKLEGELLKMKKQVYCVKSEMDLFQSELDIYLRTEKKEKQTLANMISNSETAERNCKEEEILLQKEESRIKVLEEECKTLSEQMSESQQQEKSLTEQWKNSRMKYEEAKNSLSTFKSRSGMLQAFAKEKANGRLTGVYGRLGDLGAIDEKYDVAISTACGQLDNIVTDTLATAQKCVEFLKRNNLGYATFIPLDKMTQWIPYVRSRITTPENVPRLFDLVQVKDQDVLPAFYYALRDTLVASNLEQATRIGLQGSKRYRVVTVKGELIDLAGTMSGGGGRVSRGRMGQTVVECTHTPEDVAKINQEVNSLFKNVTEIKQTIVNLENQIASKTKELQNLKLSVKKRQSNYKAYVASVEMYKIQIDEQQKKISNLSIDSSRVEELKEKILNKEKDYNERSKEASLVEEQVSKLQDEILKVTKGSMGKVKKTVDQVNKKLANVSQSITKSAVNTKTCKRNIKKIEEKIKNAEKELEDIEQTKIKLATERQNCETEGKVLCEREKKAKAESDKLKEKTRQLKTALESFYEKEHKLKAAEIEQKNDLKIQEAIESEKQSIIKNYKSRLTKLKLHEVENDSTEIPILSEEEIEKLPVKKVNAELEVLKSQLEDMKPIDLSAIDEYKKKEQIFMEKQKELDSVTQEWNLQNMRVEELTKRRLSEFMAGYTAIAKKLKEIYQMLTLGGDAELELVDSFDPFSKGIDFNVRPPKKSWKLISNLSGGEKTLSSLALVFALHYYRPTPFYVMDEIDAALDVRNVAIVGYYLKERTKNTQFIIVSLRNIMNELPDHLLGIYKTDNCSKSVNVRLASKWKEEDEEREHSNQS